MSARPAPVRIDDLANPRFAPEYEPIRAALTDAGAVLQLEPEGLMEAAIAQTGLDDFGDEAFREHLEVLCWALHHESGYGPAGIATAYVQLTQLLRNRLLIEDLVGRHPEILEVEISRPIVICGLPRTGTTHLHNLMAADPALRSLPYWESTEPVLPPGEQAELERTGGPDPRRARTAAALDVLDVALPYFKRMHEMTVDHVHEEIQLLAIDFSTALFETMAAMPTWRDHYLATDQTPVYAYLRKVLQVLQWQRGGTRWVLKSPQHLEHFAVLARTFPDATFVVTHRDPVSVTASLATMISYTARMSHAAVDPHRIGQYWAARIEDMLRACVNDREVLPAERSIDVHFDEFMADDVAMVDRIYALADQPMTPSVRAAMDAFMVEHPRGRYGGLIYELADFGLDRDERRKALQFYVDRFDVTLEN